MIGGPPTLPGSGDEPPARYVDDFRTAKGQIKRQAARFRVYAHMRDGSVQEVTASAARIEWRVAVANLKAGWYEFNQAMDLGPLSQDALRRNRAGGEHSATDGVSTSSRRREASSDRTPAAIPLDDGTFFGKPSISASFARTPRDG